jgi:ATP-binding cassette subfamily F protein uup
MEVASGAPSGKLVAELTDVCKTFTSPEGDVKVIVKDFTATLLRGDKIGLLGPNGAGKTTLLKMILGELTADSGGIRQGANLQVAYFDQMRNALDLEASLEDFISPGSEWIEIGNKRQHVKSYLGDFLFSPARATSPVKSLSGGERNRLLLARLFARPANVLVLDEPTNDLDIDTLELLEELLQDYEGTVFLVSHDRAFMDNVVTSIIACEATDDKPGFWREYEGSVQDWLTQSQRSQAIQAQNKTAAAKQALAAPAATPQTAPAKTSAATTTANESAAATVTHTSAKNLKAQTSSASPSKSNLKLSYKEQRELDALPGQIEALENEQKQIRLTLEDSSLFAKDPAQATALYARDAEIDAALMAALERWEQLSA